MVQQTQQQAKGATALPGAVPSLPQGWVRMVDPNTQRPYFVNQVRVPVLSDPVLFFPVLYCNQAFSTECDTIRIYIRLSFE